MRLSSISVGALALLSSLVAAAASPFSQGKFSISTLDGSSRLSDTFTPSSGVSSLASSENVRLDSDELIRVSFNVATTTDEEEPPSQIVVQLVNLADPSRILGWSVTPNKANGKATWSQRVDRLPLYKLGSVSSPLYSLRLLVAGTQDYTKVELGQVTIPFLDLSTKTTTGSVPADAITAERVRRGQEMGFYRWEDKRHTFRKEITEGMPGSKKSILVGVVFVVIPWVVLLSLLLPQFPSITIKQSPNLSTSILFASLLFLEVIGVRYYKGDFILFKMLPYFITGSLVAAVAVLCGGVRGVGLAK
ncbi:unnamed protein product [Sympodiomycopsis kandeliae]